MSQLDTTTHELAIEFAELRMLWLDMEHARALFERLAEMPDSIGDFRLSFALWTSGVIAYRRCFTSGEGLEKGRGRRLVPQRFIDALDPGQRELHVDALDMASGQIARRVGDHHGMELWFEVDHGPPPRVQNVQARQFTLGARTHNAFEFAALAKRLVDELNAECERVKTAILTSANESDIASWFTPTRQSPEWVNVLAGEADPISGREEAAQLSGETRSEADPGGPFVEYERRVDERHVDELRNKLDP
jgi:hypothetical protein